MRAIKLDRELMCHWVQMQCPSFFATCYTDAFKIDMLISFFFVIRQSLFLKQRYNFIVTFLYEREAYHGK